VGGSVELWVDVVILESLCHDVVEDFRLWCCDNLDMASYYLVVKVGFRGRVVVHNGPERELREPVVLRVPNVSSGNQRS